MKDEGVIGVVFGALATLAGYFIRNLINDVRQIKRRIAGVENQVTALTGDVEIKDTRRGGEIAELRREMRLRFDRIENEIKELKRLIEKLQNKSR